ncbi:CDP-alcohol phosphatidyltransferase family protein [Actinoallomurus rhizosphaericola]|uniref:CDP-alcohol phosphatidyltransferase family protein n=1 Tax=Actinoallomurus rhizosphaericola TaxID=2952536 RepID=UPI0020937A7D|nr:CDP-alcohol phosphatidyltransferase family protein [Actinoallomurus rhizosphaericola]MCO5998689.1 CDP-alcohol phosphatidyltransferase family protein [Actinoallomurus rhizosphaericola]
MTLAVVLATEAVASGSTPTAGLTLPGGAVVVTRLLAQLQSLDIADRRVIARPEFAAALREAGCEVVESKGLADDLREIARVARAAKRPMLIMHGDVVAHREVFARLVYNSKAPASAVVARVPVNDDQLTRPLIRIRKGRIQSAGSPYHQVTDPNAVFRGIVRVSQEETGTLAAVAERLADLADKPDGFTEISPLRRLWDDPEDTGDVEIEQAGGVHLEALATTPITGDDAPALLVVGLVRSGVKVTGRGNSSLVCERVLDQTQADAAQRAVDSVDEDKVRLTAAVKNNDGFFTTYAVSTYSRYIARWAGRRGWTPNAVTAISMGISIIAAGFFATGQRWGMILGGLSLYFAFVFDCVDGQLARYTRQFSTLGAWLDATFDRAKEYTVFAGLAVGSTAAAVGSSAHGGDVWFLAATAITAQTCRHMVDFAFGASKRRMPPEPIPVVPLGTPGDSMLDEPEPPKSRPKGRGLSHLAVWLSARSEQIRVFHWFKKMIVLPIGERFALIALTAAIFNARVTFIALLTWGGVAAFYTIAGRILRSLTQPRSVAVSK